MNHGHPYALPAEPDQFGTYWLGSRKLVAGRTDPIIFQRRDRRAGSNHGKYYLLAGDRGLLFRGGDFLYFDTPQLAISHLNHEVLGLQ